ncbi:MAG: NrsF family protein [Caulobacterales bacterium]|jgi:hypothetical protein
MKTDDLIDALSRNLEPAPPPKTAGPLLAALGVGLAIGATLLVLFIGVRPDIGVAMWPVLAKAGFSALFAAVAIPLVLRFARPGAGGGQLWRLLVGLVLVSLVIAAVALMGERPEARMRAWMGGMFPWCLVLIPILATPTAVGLVMLVRAFAPTRLTMAGAAIGAASGGVGAMVYAMYCPVDSMAFVATWYALAIALCAAIGSVVASRFLRW